MLKSAVVPIESAPGRRNSIGSFYGPMNGSAKQVPAQAAGKHQTLQGALYQRKGKRFSSWKRRYVVMNLENGGSISYYRMDTLMAKIKEHAGSLIGVSEMAKQRQDAHTVLKLEDDDDDSPIDDWDPAFSAVVKETTPILHFPSSVDWIIRDVEKDGATFVLEVRSDQHHHSELRTMLSVSSTDEDESLFDIPKDIRPEEDMSELSLAEDDDSRTQHEKPLRLYFRCPRRGNEKALWLKAAAKLGRLDAPKESKTTYRMIVRAAKRSRLRSPKASEFARRARVFDRRLSGVPNFMELLQHRQALPSVQEETGEFGEGTKRNNEGEKEYLVLPTYAYPHQWMTNDELHDEMLEPSTFVNDLRMSSDGDGEIGLLRVEVLQCIGLPKLDRLSETDAIVYMVCGSYAFNTDVILERSDPMWPRRSKRACIFPVFHAYSQLFVGVFDEDSDKVKDDFAGRVAIDICQLRPRCTYDVTLPLRLSNDVYMRRQRGAIRLRFRLDWHDERAAVLSYLPKKINIRNWRKPLPNSVTVQCADLKAFRNVAITVHGVHLPGRYSSKVLRSQIKEVNLYRVMFLAVIRNTIKDIMKWENPMMSSLVFLGWMHCVYRNGVALAPPYIMGYFSLVLLRNYANHGIAKNAHQGFVPLTIEELANSAARGGNEKSIEYMSPLDMKAQEQIHNNERESTKGVIVNTHQPRGNRFFRLMGFKKKRQGEAITLQAPNHVEFPFSSTAQNPRLSVESCRRTESSPGRVDSRKSPRPFFLEVPDLTKETYSLSREDSELDDAPDSDRSLGRGVLQTSFNIVEKGAHAVTSPFNKIASLMVSPRETEVEIAVMDSKARQVSSIPAKRLPEQDVDAQATGEPTTSLTDDLDGMKILADDWTYHLFDDRVYSRLDKTHYQGEDLNETGADTATAELLDKSVGIHHHANPLVYRIAKYLAPLIGVARVGLSLSRALFNAFMWKDPYLSFWLLVFCAASVPILVFFPWRMFMFVLGILCVGPQNWILRAVREKREAREILQKDEDGKTEDTVDDDKDLSETGSSGSTKRIKKGRSKRRTFSDFSRDTFSTDSSSESKPAAPVISSYNPNTGRKPRKPDLDSPQHMHVPYSPLMYNRFYDWPPEPQYARVRAGNRRSKKDWRTADSLYNFAEITHENHFKMA